MIINKAKTKEEFLRWDKYIVENPKGNHLILSDWLDSYSNYGFEKEIIYIEDNNEIVGGYGAVIAKFQFFKFYIIPYGPIVNTGYESQIQILLEKGKENALAKSCCLLQTSLPFSDNELVSDFSFPLSIENIINFKKGNPFKYVYSSYGVNLINLKGFDSSKTEDLLMSFSVGTRRKIRIGIKNIEKIKWAKTELEIKEAYDLCLLNAKLAGYQLRNWDSIKDTLLKLIESDKGIFLKAYNQGNLVGSGFFIKSGKHLTYIFGGTKKETSNIYAGYVLHWEAIKISLNLGYTWYNISLGGSEGVIKFKAMFNTIAIHYENPHYYVILKPFTFKLFNLFEKKLKPYKSKIAKWLSYLKS